MYPGDTIVGTALEQHEGHHHNMHIICHMEEKKNADKINLIQMGFFKPISGNASKRLGI